MDNNLCSCDRKQEHTRDEAGWHVVIRLIYDPMCLVHGQIGIS